MSIVYVAVVNCYDTVGASADTLYFSTGKFVTQATDTPAKIAFVPRLDQPAVMARHMFTRGTTVGKSEVSLGDLLLMNPDGGLDYLLDYAFDGRVLKVYRGDDAGAFPADFEPVLIGTMTQPEFTRTRVTLKVRDRQAEMDVPLQDTKYAGDNVLPAGLEGVEDLKDKSKPLCFGVVRNISPPCVNTAKLIYQPNDGALASVEAVRDSGISLGSTVFSFSTPTSGTANNLYGVASDGDQTLVAVGASGTILRSTDGGATWAAASTPSFGASDVWCVAFLTGTTWMAGGAAGKLAYSTDGGDNWTQVGASPFGGAEIVKAIKANATGTAAVAVGAGGTTASTADGQTWSSVANGFGGTAINAAAYGRAEFIIGGASGKYAISTDDGASWTMKTAITGTPTINAFFFGGDQYVCVTAFAGYISPDRETWTSTLSISANQYCGLYVSGTYLIGGQGNQIKTGPDGHAWTYRTPIAGTFIIYGAAATGSGAIVLVGDSGQIASTTGSGTYASQADLLDDSLAPAPGTYKVYLAGGYFRLGSSPVGQVTCDVTQGASASDRTAAQVATAVMTKRGLSSGTDWSAADVTALDSDNSAVIGLWVGTDGILASDALTKVLSSVGAWWGVDRSGIFRMARFEDPSSGTSVMDMLQAKMVAPLERVASNDPGGGIPSYRSRVRYSPNYTVQTGSQLAGGVSDANRADYGNASKEVMAETTSVQTAHLLAQELVYETLLSSSSDASTEATRLQTLRGTRRDRLRLSYPLDDATVTLDLGSIVTVYHDRFGLSAGAKCVVTSLEPDAKKNVLGIEVWR